MYVEHGICWYNIYMYGRTWKLLRKAYMDSCETVGCLDSPDYHYFQVNYVV